VVPNGRLDLLWASPECTHHSRANGGGPLSDQKRSGANWVLDWLEQLDVRCLILENVEEWLSWGDLDEKGRPVERKRGRFFLEWWNRLERLGYRAEYKVLNAADFGDATTRRRLFVQARKDGRPIVWPSPTHSKTGSADLFGGLRKWRAAREIIDWSDLGPSLFDRAKPLATKTRLRIGRGLKRYTGVLAPYYIKLLDLPADDELRILERKEGSAVEAFMVPQRGESAAGATDGPIPTVTTVARIGLVAPTAEPFVFANRNHAVPTGGDGPIGTATSATGGGLCLVSPEAEPFVLGQQGGAEARPVRLPIPVVATAGVIRLTTPTIRPFLDVYYSTGVADSIADPLSTATTKPRHALVSPIAEAFAVPYYGERPGQDARVVDLGEPLDTVTTAGRFALVAPTASFLVPKMSERPTQDPRVHDLDEPTPTVTGDGAGRLVTATLAEVRAALGAIDPRRLIFIDGVLCVLDIRFRMLFNRELAAAMGFPEGYRFTGNKTEVTRQIGNAVCVGTARALVLAMFGGDAERRLAS
jgi:DNA (cytosine-5)-methyltransferase 1